MCISRLRITGVFVLILGELFAAAPGALRDSVKLAKEGRTEAAELALTKDAFHPPSSFSWHLEIAGRLLQTAFLAQESGDMATGRRLATRALGHLDKIDRGLPADAALAVNALELRAVIVDRFTGTSTEADKLKAEARRREGRVDRPVVDDEAVQATQVIEDAP